MGLKGKLADRLLGASVTVGTRNVSNRESWLESQLKRLPAGSTILDAGAGELQYKRFCAHLDYTSQDFGEYDGEGDQRGLQTATWDNSGIDIRSDIAAIPVDAGSFDAVMCVEVLEHVPHPTEAIKEFARILKPGGALIVTTPVASLTHFAPYYFYNGYSRYYFEKVLADQGFADIRVEYNGNYFEAIAQEVRRYESVGGTYAPTSGKPSVIDRLATRLVLRRLDVLSRTGSGSEELSSFGLNVTATKPS